MQTLTATLTRLLSRSVLFGMPTLLLAATLQPTIARANSDVVSYGRSGMSQTVFLKPDATPRPLNYDLSGRDGRDGVSYGSYLGNVIDHNFGSRRQDCHVSGIGGAGDVTMPSGQSGISGGDGGDGGNGGSLTVYYQNLSDLSNIFLNASPGRGGRGGLGGPGQRGCDCPQSEWKVGDKTYKCTDGSTGLSGSTGRSGRTGEMGSLFLIRGTEPIASDTPSYRNVLSQLILPQPYTLTRNRWEQKPGALSLLAPGSIVNENYQEYRDRIEKTVKLTWDASTSLSEYGSQYAMVKLENTGAIAVEFNDTQLWAVVQQSEAKPKPNAKPNEPPVTQVSITSMIHQREVTQLTPGLSDKRNREFTLNIIDSAAKSDVLNTQFSVRVRSVNANGRFGSFNNGTTEYEGVVPANLVTRDYNRFILNLGALPIDSEVFRAGAEVEVELTATRSLGSRSAQQKIDWSGTVY